MNSRLDVLTFVLVQAVVVIVATGSSSSSQSHGDEDNSAAASNNASSPIWTSTTKNNNSNASLSSSSSSSSSHNLEDRTGVAETPSLNLVTKDSVTPETLVADIRAALGNDNLNVTVLRCEVSSSVSDNVTSSCFPPTISPNTMSTTKICQVALLSEAQADIVEDKANNMEIQDVVKACRPQKKRPPPHNTNDDDEDDDNSTLIITLSIIAVAVVVGIGAVLFMFVYRPSSLAARRANNSKKSTRVKYNGDENSLCEREMALNIDEHNDQVDTTI